MSTKLNSTNYVPRNEFDIHKTETQNNFSMIFSKLEDSNRNLNDINTKVVEIQHRTHIIDTRVDAILDNINLMNSNMDMHFDLIREASLAREENNKLRLEDLLEEKITTELSKHQEEAATPKDEDSEQTNNTTRNSIISIVLTGLTGLTGIIVAFIKIIPSLIGK